MCMYNYSNILFILIYGIFMISIYEYLYKKGNFFFFSCKDDKMKKRMQINGFISIFTNMFLNNFLKKYMQR